MPSGFADPPPVYDGWEISEQLRHIERILQPTKPRDAEAATRHHKKTSRLDSPHAEMTDWHIAAQGKSKSRKANRKERSAGFGALTWLILFLGTAVFVGGGVLSGWAWFTERQDDWMIGLLAMVAGPVALLIGLILQIHRLRRDNHTAAVKLDHIHKQLNELKSTTTLLGTNQSSNAGAAFYSHFAGGATPHLLLADLKSQLDLLATKIAQDDL
jgi:hypothetical protein